MKIQCAKCGKTLTKNIHQRNFALAESHHFYRGRKLLRDIIFCADCDAMWWKLWVSKNIHFDMDLWFDILFKEFLIKQERILKTKTFLDHFSWLYNMENSEEL
jgi:hypothetical protein